MTSSLHVKASIAVFVMLICGSSARAQQIVRIQNRWHQEQEVNVERGLASSPTQPGWNSAMWIPEPVDSIYIRLRNLWTGAYLRMNGTVLEAAVVPPGPDSMWEVEPVASGTYYRLRNRNTGTYLHIENGPLTAGPIQSGWLSAMWVLQGYNGPGARLGPSQWMRQNAEIIGNIPLNRVVLPGSHDSGTYALQTTYVRPPTDAFAPDTDEKKRGFSFAGELGYNTWARAQGVPVLQQLSDGIRYIDVRICVDRSGNLLTCHGLYAAPLQTVLDDIARFASANPRELVVVHFQHIYEWSLKLSNRKEDDAEYEALSSSSASRLDTMIARTLGSHLIPRAIGNRTLSPTSTVREFWNSDRQVILVTRDLFSGTTPQVEQYLWRDSEVMDYHWRSGTNRNQRIADIQSALTNGSEKPGQFLGVPFSLTPEDEVYGKSFDPLGTYPSSLRSMAAQVNPVLLSYLASDWRGLKANIITTDWYNDSCLIPVAKMLNGIPVDIRPCNLTRNTTWGSWRLGIETAAETVVGTVTQVARPVQDLANTIAGATAPANPAPGAIPYRIRVKTGTRSGAGTDSNIYLTISGQKGQAPETRLNGYISGDAFESGDTDSLTVSLRDVGIITGVRIRSDNQFAGSGWDFSWIEINGKRFSCNCWIDGDRLSVTLR